MAEVVDFNDIERLVGAKRGILHKAMLVRPGDPRGDWLWVINVLHSVGCFGQRGSGGNSRHGKPEGLLECSYTWALDSLLGTNRESYFLDEVGWRAYVDVPVIVGIRDDVLVPLGRAVR